MEAMHDILIFKDYIDNIDETIDENKTIKMTHVDLFSGCNMPA